MILVYLGGLLTGVGMMTVALIVAAFMGDESDEMGVVLYRGGEPFGYDHAEGPLPKGYRPVPRERAELIRGNGRGAS